MEGKDQQLDAVREPPRAVSGGVAHAAARRAGAEFGAPPAAPHKLRLVRHEGGAGDDGGQAAATPAAGLPETAGPRVSVVIPALNEERNLPHAFANLPADVHEVVLVDGHSTDATVRVARELRPDVKVVVQTARGKGDALAAGFAACTGDIIVSMDADGSTNASEIPRFVAELLDGADYVKGSRYLREGGSADLTWLRSVGNRLLGQLVNLLYRTRYTDLCYGYNAFWRRHLPWVQPECDGFEVETLMNIRAAKTGLVVREVPSYEECRIHGRSKLNTWSDGWRVLGTIVAELRRASVHPAAAPLHRH